MEKKIFGAEIVRRGLEIKNAFKHNSKVANSHRSLEGKKGEGGGWAFYDESIEDFGDTFVDCLPLKFIASHQDIPEKLMFKEYIDYILRGERKKELKAIEIGGPGSRLFKGFRADLFQKTVGICLKDVRTEEKKKEDKKNNHSVIPGDILNTNDMELWEKISNWSGNNKVDLIVIRMIAGRNEYRLDSYILEVIFRKMYKILDQNGLMFIQFGGDKYKITSWMKAIEEKFPELEIKIIMDLDIMRLHKKDGSPKELPLVVEA